AFLATQTTVKAKIAAAKSGNGASATEAEAAEVEAKDALKAAKVAMNEAKTEREQAGARKQVTAEKLRKAEGALKDARQAVEVIEQAIAREKAEAEARAKAEQERLEAEALARKQAQAEEIARMRAAQAKQKAEADAQAKAAAEADAQARAHAVAMCTEFWNNKLVDRLEERLGESLAKWPDEPELLVLLARLRLLQGRADDALELVETVPATGATGRKARMVAAGVYLSKNLPMEAMKVLEALMREDPRDPDACFNMAVTMLRLPAIDPKRDLAAKYYTRSVQLGGKRSLAMEQRLEME
ncbi:MAG: tetratricopeptide repeat protein, partial [Candidatus Spyradenecus sp.]